MGPELSLTSPVVHCLPRDECEFPVDGNLGEVVVLDGVRPTPQDLPGTHAFKITQKWLGQKNHVCLLQYLLAGGHSTHILGEMLIREPEAETVPMLQHNSFAEVFVDVLEVLRMNRQP